MRSTFCEAARCVVCEREVRVACRVGRVRDWETARVILRDMVRFDFFGRGALCRCALCFGEEREKAEWIRN